MSAAKLLSSALRLYDSKKYDAALPVLEKVIAAEPNNPIAHFKAAVCLRLHARDFDRSKAHFERSIALKPTADAICALGVLLHTDLNKPDEAIAKYNQALGVEPSHALSHFNLATVYLDSQDYNKSIVHFELAASHGLQQARVRLAEVRTKLLCEADRPPAYSPAPEYTTARSSGEVATLISSLGWPQYAALFSAQGIDGIFLSTAYLDNDIMAELGIASPIHRVQIRSALAKHYPAQSKAHEVQPRDWSAEQTAAWIKSLGLGEHAPAFQRLRIDGPFLRDMGLSDDVLAELGVVSTIARTRLQRAVNDVFSCVVEQSI